MALCPEFMYTNAAFAPELRAQSMFLQREDGGDMFAPDAAAKVQSILDQILVQETSNGTTGAELCLKVQSTSPQCLIESPYLTMSRLQQQAQAGSPGAAELVLNEEDVTLRGRPVIENLGGAEVDASSGRVLSATSVYIEWLIKPADLEAITTVEEWEKLFVELDLESDTSAPPKLQVLRQSGSSYAAAVNSAVLSSIPFYAISAFAMQLYILFEFGSMDIRKSRVTLGICGEVAVLLSSLSALGFYCWMGFELTHMTSCGLFLLMGIGLDDMFVLLKTFEREPPSHTTEQRLIDSMKEESGMSITMTSLTNVIAFSIGGYLPFPALSDFCVFLSIGVAFTFIYFLTFFVACIVLDAKRYDDGHGDPIMRPLLCCLAKCRGGDHAVRVLSPSVTVGEPKERDDKMLMAIEQIWAPLLLNTATRRACWSLLYGLLLCASIYGIRTIDISVSRATAGLEDGSMLMGRYQAMDSEFRHRTSAIDIVFRGSTDYSASAAEIATLRTCVEASNFTTGTVTSWTDQFEGWRVASGVAVPASVAEFDELVKVWLEQPNTPPAVAADIAWDEAGERIIASRMHARHFGAALISGPQDGLDAMASMQRCTDASSLDAFPFAALYATDFAEIEVLIPTIWVAMGVTLTAVVSVTILMPGVHVRNALVLCGVMYMCCVNIIGIISLTGVKFWSQTLVQVVIAIGLAVDYSIHIGHVFSTTYDQKTCATRVARARFALSTMGSSVLRGAITTLLGIVPLFFGSFSALDEFARNIFIIVLVGLLHGFLVLPIGLATFGHDRDQTDDEQIDEQWANVVPRGPMMEIGRVESGSPKQAKLSKKLGSSSQIKPHLATVPVTEIQTEPELPQTLNVVKGSQVEVFSNSANAWIQGTVVKIDVVNNEAQVRIQGPAKELKWVDLRESSEVRRPTGSEPSTPPEDAEGGPRSRWAGAEGLTPTEGPLISRSP